ncbi:hypothetical protein D9M68_375660 [compost metagenome]
MGGGVNVPRLDNQQVEYLWAAGDHEPDWRPELREHLKTIAEASGVPLGQWLLGKCSMREVSAEHVRDLEAQLGTNHALRNMLRTITQRLRRQIPGFPLARIAIAVERPANPINPDIYTAERLRRSRQLLNVLQQGLRLDLDSFRPEERIGLLLMSAAYGGGLMDIAQLNALVEVSLERIEWIAGIPELRLPLSIRGKVQAEHRQWFPDPATLALLTRCSDDMRAMGARLRRRETVLRCIRAFLGRSGVPSRDLPTSLTELLDLLRMQMQLRLPQILVNFACRHGFVSQSLRPSSWGEMFGYPGLEDPVGTYGDSVRSDEYGEEKTDTPDWVLDLCRQIRAGDPVDPSPATEDSESLEVLIREWAAYLVGGSSAYGHDIGRSSITRYARLLGEALASQLDGQSVFQMEPDALEIVYETVLDAQITDSKRRTLAKAIHEFHAFLGRRYHYPPISPYSVLGIGRDVASVDARILSEDQYQAVLRALDTSGLELRTPRLVTAAKLFLILGFRLGLRRNEALKLRLSDLHLPELSSDARERIRGRHPEMRILSNQELAGLELPVDLLVRPHAQRGLKTQNSVRRLPLRLLLEPEELELLMVWYQQRQVEETRAPSSEFLFCIPELRTQWVSESTLLPALHACMRAVTGSEVIHYHHLRHSCATWQMLKLMGTITDSAPELIFRDLPLTTRWLSDNARQREALISANGGPTRRIVHIVSALLGHGSPKTSLLHYIHSLPLVMAQAWQWNPRVWLFSAHNVASIAKVSLPTTEASSVGGPEHLLRVIGRIRSLKAKRRPRRTAVCFAVQQVENNWAIERIRRIESMLAYASYVESSGRQINLEWLEFATEERSMMLDRAQYIRSLTQRSQPEAGGKHRLRASMQAETSSLIPMPPRHGGRDAVAGYAERLYELLDGAESERANRAIDDFVERCWATETTLRFYRDCDEEHTRDYLWLLTAIGVPAQSIELIIYDTRKPRAAKSYWRQQLGNIRRPISQHAPENPDAENTHLGIRATLALEEGRQQNRHSGAALRYLFLMASIDWHFRT